MVQEEGRAAVRAGLHVSRIFELSTLQNYSKNLYYFYQMSFGIISTPLINFVFQNCMVMVKQITYMF